jgi:PiT family inorganic phosphate transporter
VHTVGRGIVRLGPLDAFASQTAATLVILPASYAGAPVSTTHVVASSVIGIGAGRRRWRHVRWEVVRAMTSAWVLTLPVCGVLGALAFVLWRGVG